MAKVGSLPDNCYNPAMRAMVFFLAAFLAPAADAAPVKEVLGQYPLPSGKGIDQFHTGFMRVGHYFKNDRSAASARPDGTGTAYNSYQAFFHDAYRGNKAGFLADFLFLSDQENKNNFKFAQFNYLLGVTFKGENWRLQFDREEIKPIDRGGRSFRYWDVRATLPFDTGIRRQRKRRANRMYVPAGGKPFLRRVRGALTIGYFLHNNSYPARADLSGLAKLRYHARGDVQFSGAYRLLGEIDFLTDEHRSLHPVGMSFSYGIGASFRGVDVAFLRKVTEDIDRAGFHPYLLLNLTYTFDSRQKKK